MPTPDQICPDGPRDWMCDGTFRTLEAPLTQPTPLRVNTQCPVCSSPVQALVLGRLFNGRLKVRVNFHLSFWRFRVED